MAKVRNTILYCCACAAAVAAGALGGTYYYSMSHKAEVIDFTGKNITIARDWATKNRVADRMVYTYEFNEEAEKDIILKQSMKAGSMLGSDQFLNLNVSKGADPDKEFELADFTGKKEDEIRAWFEEKKFSDVVFEYRFTDEDEYEEGSFISLTPENLKKAKRSAHIAVTVATKKSEDIVVADLTLYSMDNLNAWAAENKLSVSYVWVYDDAPYGTILSSDPAAGSTVHTSDEITVTVSAGKEQEEQTEISDEVLVNTGGSESTPEPTPKPESTPAPVPADTASPEPVTGGETVSPDPEPEPGGNDEPAVPEPPVEETPQPVIVGGCPVSIPAAIFTNATADDVIRYYGTESCAWNVITYADSTSNPNNYMGLAHYEVDETLTYANLYMYVRWQ